MGYAVRVELDHEIDLGDGVFYMPIEDYLDQVQYTTINYNTENWFHDYFLVLDDNGAGSS